jgi:hypothetical protein
MPAWDNPTLDRFIDAEAALVAKQLSSPRGAGNVWTAWRNIAGAMRDYGSDLAEGRFEQIKTAVEKL